MRSTSKALLLGLAAILAARLFAMAVMPLADTSEPRYAEIARLMAVTGDWVTPWFEPGVPFWGKPPLAFWAPALSIKLLGLSEFSLRLPAFAAMLGVLALVHAFAARRFGVSAARWAALVFATMLLPLASAGAVLTDPYLALGVTLSMTSFLLARRDGPRGGAMASSWVWRSACCPRGRWPWCWWRPPCCPGRCCPPDARSGARCPGSAARS
ncbi:phospholipid carrier-dependent glycosyltransferase [Achromobacter xylosoxidans]